MGFKERAMDFMLYRNCNSARTFVVMSSAIFALLLMADPDGMNPIMSEFAEPFVWTMMFGAHALIGATNINAKLGVSYLEAGLGFLVWSVSTLCVLSTAGHLQASVAPNVTCAVLSWWILIRVGVKHG